MVTEQVLRRMTYVPGSHVLVPKLKRLAISAELSVDNQVIVDMVQSRRRHLGLLHGDSGVNETLHQVETLEFISLDFDLRTLDPATIAQIASLQERGLEVQLKSLGEPVALINYETCE
jgi:hypothetical protein